MRIATWNIERLKHKDKIDEIKSLCQDIKADIMVLTEADKRLQLDYKYCIETLPAKDINPELYRDTENRVSIYTDYPVIRRYDTYDKYTALCVELETEQGNLLVYGTIMGNFGNREKSYMPDLEKQMEDVRRLSALGSICIAGDYNCSFSDNYYFVTDGRNLVRNTFEECGISILTEMQPQCIDHIAVSDSFVGNAVVNVSEWNMEKTLSDHKGIMTEIACDYQITRGIYE